MAIRINSNNEKKILGYLYSEKKTLDMPFCDVYLLQNGQTLLVIRPEYVIPNQTIRTVKRQLVRYKKLGSLSIQVPTLISKEDRIGLVFDDLDGVSILEYYAHSMYTFRDLDSKIKELIDILAFLHKNSIYELIHPSQLFIQDDALVFIPSIYMLFDHKESIYCPPEVLKSKSITAKSDIYSLGLLLHRLFCGALPWDNQDSTHTIAKKKFGLNGSFSPRNVGAHLEESTITTLEKMLEESLENRFETVLEVHNSFLGVQEKYTYTYRENKRLGWNPNAEGTYQKLEELVESGYEVRWFDGTKWQLF